MKKAVFLDKDGTLVKNIPYNIYPEKMILEKFVGEGLQVLASLGYELVVVSNQSGIARGYFEENDLQYIFEKLQTLVQPFGVFFSGFYYCPHYREAKIEAFKKDCNCRKPLPGMFYQAAAKQHLALSESWMIGDILDDCEAGKRAGCKTILINNGNETKWLIDEKRIPEGIVSNFLEAAYMIRKDVLDATQNVKNEEFNVYG